MTSRKSPWASCSFASLIRRSLNPTFNECGRSQQVLAFLSLDPPADIEISESLKN